MHKPRILLLYGSTRPRSFSRLLVQEAERLLQHLGAETRVFNPSGLPLHTSQSAGIARTGALVGGASLVLARTSRCNERGI